MRVTATSGRFRNFDTLRLLAASAVLFSHAFAITEGTEVNEPFVRLLGPGNILGLYGVYVFFVISGFLITRSFVRRRSTVDYLLKRCLRLLPGLFVCALVVAFVLGPLLTALTPATYFGDSWPYKYVIKTTVLLDSSDASLPGVVFAQNDYGALVNGSLWTLGPEFLCYLGVAALGLCGLLRPVAAAALLALGLWSHTHASGAFANIGYLLPFFAAGSLVHHLHERRGRPGPVSLALCGVALVLGAVLGWPAEAFALFGAVLVLQLATTERISLGDGARFGDASYGLYLYGWPVEETVRRLLGDGAVWWHVFAISLPAAALLGLASWHLVEKHALRAARPLGARLTHRDVIAQSA